jgi:uncharacterized membrane protein
MANILRFLQVFALGTWVGAIMYLSFVVAPGAFATLASRDQAGAFVGLALGRLHHFGTIAAAIYIVAGFVLTKWPKVSPAMYLVAAMMILTAISHYRITPHMADLRHQMVSVDATPRDNPLRAEFDRLHQWSVRIEGSVLLLGIAALYLTVRRAP